MAETQYGSKRQLVALIRRVVSERQTGLVSILTDTKHAVLLKIFEGKLVHLHSRTRNIEDVVQVLNECEWVKFKFASVTMENRPEFMPIETFLQLIETEDSEDVTTDPAPAMPNAGSLTNVARGSRETEPLIELLVKIASEYVGPVANMVVEEAFENDDDPIRAIEYIAEMIPDSRHAADFRAEARKTTQLISL